MEYPLFVEEKFNYHISSMHEVVPRVVAIAVRMVMAKWMIFCQNSFFMMYKFKVMNVGTLRAALGLCFEGKVKNQNNCYFVIQTTEGRTKPLEKRLNVFSC